MSVLSRWEAVTKIQSALCPEGKEIFEQGLEGIRRLIEEAEKLGIGFELENPHENQDHPNL